MLAVKGSNFLIEHFFAFVSSPGTFLPSALYAVVAALATAATSVAPLPSVTVVVVVSCPRLLPNSSRLRLLRQTRPFCPLSSPPKRCFGTRLPVRPSVRPPSDPGGSGRDVVVVQGEGRVLPKERSFSSCENQSATGERRSRT